MHNMHIHLWGVSLCISFSGAKFHQDLTDAEGLQSVLAGNPANGKERTQCVSSEDLRVRCLVVVFSDSYLFWYLGGEITCIHI